MRGVLVTAVYKKSLTVSANEAEELAAITLMSADVDGIEQLISMCYDSWALVLETVCGVTILSFFVGAACFITVVVATGESFIDDTRLGHHAYASGSSQLWPLLPNTWPRR